MNITQVGEMRFTVMPAEESATDASSDAATAPFVVAAQWQGSAGPLPGKERILHSFRAVCWRHSTPEPANSRVTALSLFRWVLVWRSSRNVMCFQAGQHHVVLSYGVPQALHPTASRQRVN